MDYFCGLIHGDTGAGKTVFGGSMAQVVRTLHICIDRYAEETLKTIPGDREIRSPSDFSSLVKYHRYLAAGKHNFGGWVIDSVTQGIQNFRVELTGVGANNYHKTPMLSWMELYERWRLLLKDFIALPMHGMILAMSQRELDELEPGTKEEPNYIVKPFIETKLRDVIGGYLPALGFCYKKHTGGRNHYYISFERGGIDTKLCGAKLPQMEDPTFAKVWQAIQKQQNKKGEENEREN